MTSTIAVSYLIFVHFFTPPRVSLIVAIVIKCFTAVSQVEVAKNAGNVYVHKHKLGSHAGFAAFIFRIGFMD